MRILPLTLALLALLALPTSAAAKPWPRIPTPTTTIIPEACPEPSTNAGATEECAYSDGRIYLPEDSTPFMREHAFGHIYDAQRLDQGERNKLIRELGTPGRSWHESDPYAGVSERFADAYAACRLHLDPDHHWESAYDYSPSPRAFRRVCATIARAADPIA